MRAFRLFGHALHPPMVHAPMGLWLSVPAWDLLAFWSGRPVWWAVSFWCLIGGLVAAVPAAATGLLDLAALPTDPQIEHAADRHWLLVLTSAAAFALSAYLRGGSAPPESAPWCVALSTAGVAVLSVAGWFGGELVARHGAGRVP